MDILKRILGELILGWAYIREGLIFGGKFVLMIRGAYILGGLYQGGLYSGFYGL